MGAFLIYNPTTGAIQGSLSASHAGVLDIAANTPVGMSSLAIDLGHAVITDTAAWTVKAGALAVVVLTDAELLATAKASKLSILTTSYNAAKTANVAYMNTSFMADADSQDLFAHAVLVYGAAEATPSDFFTVDASGNKVPMTLAQLQGLTNAIATQVLAAFQRWFEVRQSLASAATIADVQAVTW